VPSFSRKFLPEIGLSVLEWVIFVQEIIEFVMIVLPPDAFLILIVARKGILGTPIPTRHGFHVIDGQNLPEAMDRDITPEVGTASGEFCSPPLKMYSSVPPSVAAPRYRNSPTDMAGTASKRVIRIVAR
jgi:hypothetical protein